MSQSTLHKLFDNRDWLLADGATGTNYFAMGLQSGDAPELWNVSHPERVASLHRTFVDAGADIILTNSFGGSSYRLKLHQAQGRVAELNFAALVDWNLSNEFRHQIFLVCWFDFPLFPLHVNVRTLTIFRIRYSKA